MISQPFNKYILYVYFVPGVITDTWEYRELTKPLLGSWPLAGGTNNEQIDRRVIAGMNKCDEEKQSRVRG